MDIVEALFALSSGGSDVAVQLAKDKTSNPLSSLGRSSAGIEAAIEWFDRAIQNGQQSFLFLVGGPGGGKSHTTSRIVSGLTEIAPKTQFLAHRKHNYFDKTGKQQITVINDATIQGREHTSFPLVKDIHEATLKGNSLIVCVNRGVLLEESLCDETEFSEATALIKSLQDNSSTEGNPILENLKFNILDRKIAGLKVAFDINSLFEPLPDSKISVDSEGTNLAMSDPYRIERYSKRIEAPLEVTSIASELFESVAVAVKDSYSQAPGSMDPVQANLQTLSNSRFASTVSSVIRASEIVAGKRYTYRELWGHVVRATVGNLPEVVPSPKAANYINSLQPKNKSAIEDFEMAARLADFRFNQSLFGVKFGQAPGSHLRKTANQILHTMAFIDPFKDMQPGLLQNGALKNGWATPLHDAFSSAFAAISPLGAIIKYQRDDAFDAIVTDFDRKLDEYFVKAMDHDSMRSQKRSEYIAWYSGYLTRLFALSHGLSAFADIVDAWTKLWSITPLIPEEVEENFLTLIRPSRVPGSNSASLVPLFDSRTLAIQGDLIKPKLALRVNDVEVHTEKSGDSVFLVLEESNKQTAKILLDFPLLREAMACTSGFTGVTELSSLAAPRLERIRASNLVAENQKAIDKYRIATSLSDIQFTIKGKND